MKLDMRKKQEKKETTKSTKKLPMTAKMKRAMAVYIVMVLIMTAGASTVFAADDPLTVINNLSTFIFGLIRAIGMILLGFGIVQVGLSLKSHDPSQRANGFLTLAGADAGCGLVKYGSSLVPFVNRFPTNTRLYKLMTTKPGEDSINRGRM